MFLSELELNGFKSFANKTKFKFSEGITAVVGPNGCGKSNVVDAVRWVLGEQKTSVLRSDSMESVIFNGTASRKPTGMAEVTMTLENNKGVLSSDYETVQVTRRLFRSGDSHYLLNKTKCRLKDINNLFMDTGMGPDSYSVIELKMVEALINGKMDERRRMIEEAAGVTRYKQRRKEASNKLKRVQEDLERVQDIISEVETNVNRLSRQASKTRRYNTLSEELKELEVELLKHEYHSISERSKENRESYQEVKNEANEFSKKVENLEKELEKLREKRSTLDEKIKELQNAENNIRNTVSETKRSKAVNAEKITSLKSTVNRLKDEIERGKSFSEKIEEEISENKTKLKKRDDELEEQKEANAQLKKNKDEAQKKLSYARELANSDREEINKLKNRIESAYSIIKNNENRIEKIESKISNSKEEIARSEAQIDEKDNEAAELDNKIKTAQSLLNDTSERLEIAQNNLEVLNNDLANVNEKIADLKNKISGKNASLDFLNSISIGDNATQLLLESDEWDKPSDLNTLIELITTDDSNKQAISTLFGSYSNLIILDKRSQAESAFEFLKSKNKAKKAFVCKELLPPVNIEADNNPDYLYNNIDADDEIKKIIYSLFGKVAITNSNEKAIEAISNGKYDIAVTRDGFLATKKGILTGGGTSKGETQAIGKKKRIDKTTKEIAELEKELSAALNEKEKLSNQKNEINLNELKSELNQAERNVKQLNDKKTQISVRKQGQLNNIEMYAKSIGNSERELKELKQEIDELSKRNEEDKARLKDAQSNEEEKLSLLNEAEKNFNKINEELQAAEILTIKLNSERNSLDNDVKRALNQQSAEERRREQRYREIKENEERIAELEFSNEQSLDNLETDEKKLNTILSEKEQQEEAAKIVNDEMVTYTNDLHESRAQLDNLREKYHKAEIKISEADTKMEALNNRAIEAYELDLSQIDITLEEGFNIEESKREVSQIKTKLSNLGNINFEAVQEYEEQSERLTFLTKQVNDLNQAEKTLMQTITEINETAEERFTETFEKIRDNFKMLFKKLFNEQAVSDIVLEEDNPLESSIEIIAKPPGKKPRSIDMLSGGEKTLTAIALLFAIYLVKPSPFCILDEVDAPLDDANLRRFNTLIKEFSKNTQFLIVTHMKITMEAADTLYGITQQEVGVSKIVSVKLEKDHEITQK